MLIINLIPKIFFHLFYLSAKIVWKSQFIESYTQLRQQTGSLFPVKWPLTLIRNLVQDYSVMPLIFSSHVM